MKLSFKIFLCCFCIAALFSCSSDDVIDMRENEVPSVSLSYDESLEHFGIMLSKAVSNDENVRKFVKDQVLMKIDNGYNIFYPVVKDKKVVDGTSFRQILMNYATDKKELLEIERNLPLLNIHMPQFDSVKVTSLDVKSDELPVLVNKKLFVKGELVDTIGDLEVPVFNVLVVTESSTIKKKTAGTRSNLALSLNDEFEYTDISFVPRRQETRSLLYDEDIVNDGFEDEEHRKYDIEKYHGKTLPVDSIDPRLVTAFKKAVNLREATRCLMYYNLKNTSEEFDKNRSIDCADCIYRFRLSKEIFSYIDEHNGGDKFLKSDETHNKSSHLKRSDVLDRLKTGRVINFLFHVVDTTEQDIPFSAQPEDVFNISISYQYVHRTLFRRSNNIYRIDFNNFKSKWYYPHEHGNNLRFSKWDIFRNSINKRIYFYFVPTKNDVTETLTEESTVTYIVNNSVNGKINAESLVDDVKAEVGYNGSWSKNHSTRITKVSTYKFKPLLLSEFNLDFFDDYPISSISNDKVNFNVPISTGQVEFNILPISNDFYNNKMKK